jgi:hypothetical protein
LLRGTRIELTPSRFLDGLPEEHVEVYERPEKQELGTDEIAALGRAFLAQKKAQAQQTR